MICVSQRTRTRNDHNLVGGELSGVHRFITSVDELNGHIRWGHLIQVVWHSQLNPHALGGGGDDLFAVKRVNHKEASRCASNVLQFCPFAAVFDDGQITLDKFFT